MFNASASTICTRCFPFHRNEAKISPNLEPRGEKIGSYGFSTGSFRSCAGGSALGGVMAFSNPPAVPSIRPMGGQARTAASRHTMVATMAPIRTTSVAIHAAVSPMERRGSGAVAASRSIAVIAGVSHSAACDARIPAGTTDGSGASASGASASRELASRASVSWAIHSPPQRTHRTILCDDRRDAGTSYSAAQLGQVIRIAAYHARERNILENISCGRHGSGALGGRTRIRSRQWRQGCSLQ